MRERVRIEVCDDTKVGIRRAWLEGMGFTVIEAEEAKAAIVDTRWVEGHQGGKEKVKKPDESIFVLYAVKD